MQLITFLTEFIKHPKTIGAISPSSKKLAHKMVQPICFETAQCIVELGPGMGSFTTELVKRKQPATLLILIEHNAIFCEKLRHQFAHEANVVVVNGSAENLRQFMDELHIEKIDYVISGLPFTSLKSDVSCCILSNVKDCLHNGKFITFQYSLVKKAFFQTYFEDISHEKVWMNMPPAYVLSCKLGHTRAS
ncbi:MULTISPECIES: rRNA adenine N-6-methyltransferase family protein [unclassified Lysinibacillus]|uniref:class I SAM-dependent methyltransferase n=1 Tax=unclassified Lysinibacillus TaxID=2636778 RepID=UPI000888C828|nr:MULTISPECIES: rRNA adenine N-6-methyltransferase family protein [unclassified Lysinibacillus]WCH49018.1 SAM-dependent methyltransferase [Lysinibacillus sp. OF-1]SCX94126.1 Phospholipid N-methyltransferase [Lysinibacillus sp. SG9]SDB07171.1 Phospholipid N-methyltransferase [Lysinibacillus sp. TC-37]SFS39193.1 Phospholipid N-methyltransferase [Lysinibacillus sp. SG55]